MMWEPFNVIIDYLFVMLLWIRGFTHAKMIGQQLCKICGTRKLGIYESPMIIFGTVHAIAMDKNYMKNQ
jgi:hypothetical protein